MTDTPPTAPDSGEKIYNPKQLAESGRFPGMTYRQILYLIETKKLKATNVGTKKRPRFLIRESAIEKMMGD